tara:strand:- start:21835 stop:22041 length:207 start_codon:yes stop_codon:yes gene_type:complete
MKLGTSCVPEDTLSFTGCHNADFTLDIGAMTGRGEHLKATAYFAESAASMKKFISAIKLAQQVTDGIG